MNAEAAVQATAQAPAAKPAIELPWRTFKAFVQLFDMETGISRVTTRRLLMFSPTKAGEKIRNELAAHRLIFDSEEMGRYVLLRGLPLGREPDPDHPGSPIVRPVSRSLKGIAWNMTEGRCAYCGSRLAFFSHVSIYPTPALVTVTEELPPLFACKPCHSTRGPRSLEEMRHLLGMREFEHRHGVRFDRRQLAFLKSRGCELEIPRPAFWFEKQKFGTGAGSDRS